MAGQCVSFSLGRWFSEMRVVFGMVGWSNGMVQLLVGTVSLFAAREMCRERGLDGSPQNAKKNALLS